MKNSSSKNNIFVLLDRHHSRALISTISIITKNNRNKLFPIFIGGEFEHKIFENENKFHEYINFEDFNLSRRESLNTKNFKPNFMFSFFIHLKKLLKNYITINLKNSSLFSIAFQQIIYLRLLKKLQKAKILIRKYNPKLLITLSDREHSDIISVLSKAAKINNVPIILMNLNIYCKENAWDYRQSINKLDTTKNKNLYDKFSLFFLKSCIYKKTLYQEREHLLAHKMFGSLSQNPWWNGNGLSDFIIATNGFDRYKLIENKVKKSKIVTIGNPEYQLIYKNLKNKNNLKKKIINKYQFNPEKKLIIAAVPQWYEQGMVSLDDHLNEIKFYCDSLSNTQENILLSLHPRQIFEDYNHFQKGNMKISKTPLSSIISCGDRFVSGISSTIIWSTLIGIPTVVYDPFKINKNTFIKFKTVKICQTKKGFSENISSFKLNKKSITDDWKFLERHKVMRGDLSSKYNDLLSNFL